MIRSVVPGVKCWEIDWGAMRGAVSWRETGQDWVPLVGR